MLQIPRLPDDEQFSEVTVKRNPSVLIIGAGATGLAAAVHLRAVGITDIVIVEKGDQVGGTWRDNTYPGVACDVPGFHYSFSFEPCVWQHFMAHGHHIQQYLEHVAQKYGIIEVIRFNRTVVELNYKNGRWQVHTNRDEPFDVDFVIAATGILHHPVLPDIDGRDSFAGQHWHSARWQHNVDLTGKRVAVVGTGSSAHQIVPALVDDGHDVTVFQRTAQWTLPISNFEIPERVRRRWVKKPERMRGWKKRIHTFIKHVLVKASLGHRFQSWLIEKICKAHLRFAVRDRELREQLTPSYTASCKRLVVGTRFYQALQQSNASLVTKAIDSIQPEGIRTDDGMLHQFDTIIYATGFSNLNYMRPMDIRGRDGQTIGDSWAQGHLRTYKSLMIEKMPNFFLTLGPGSPIANNSIIAVSETQLLYIIKLINLWRGELTDEVEPTVQAIDAYDQWLQSGMSNTAWVTGCQSWYLAPDGRPITFPYQWKEFVKSITDVDPDDLTMDRPMQM